MAQCRYLRTIWMIAAIAAGALVILLLARSAPVAHAVDGASVAGKRTFKHCGRGTDPRQTGTAYGPTTSAATRRGTWRATTGSLAETPV